MAKAASGNSLILLALLLFTLFCTGGEGLSDALEEEELWPSGGAGFDPNTPSRHATWKGRKTLPKAAMRTLCHDIALYLGFQPDNTAAFLLEIAAAESDFGFYVRQVKGPAQSVWQIEPETAKDMHERLPKRHPLLYKKIVALRDPNLSEEDNVVTNLHYGCALCAGVLWLKGIRFETLSSLSVRAATWKRFYNTYLGKGTLEGYCQKAARYLGEAVPEAKEWQEPFNGAMLAEPDIFARRNAERFRELPPGFDESPMGRYYKKILQERPEVFEQVPTAVLRSKNIRALMGTLLLELVRKVQADPASIGRYKDMPDEIFRPLVAAAMAENALKAYPMLPKALQNDPEIQKNLEAQKLLLERLPMLQPR